jgi:tetratricopeptide (TPR) repeat protein
MCWPFAGHEAERAVTFSGNSAASLGCIGGCYAALGRNSEAKKVIEELQELSKRQYVSPSAIGWVYLSLGDKDAALAHLERAYAERSAYLSLLKVEPSFDFLRSVWFAKTLADFEINDLAALPPLFCYNSLPCFDSSACASERWFASCARIGASYSRISRYVNNSPS